jgi:hypothetical protein
VIRVNNELETHRVQIAGIHSQPYGMNRTFVLAPRPGGPAWQRTRDLVVIGWAVKQLPAEVRSAEPEIE